MGTRSAITVPEGRVVEREIFKPIVEVGLYTFTVENFRITETRSLHTTIRTMFPLRSLWALTHQ